jgi:SAM-dependent methyltransferase
MMTPISYERAFEAFLDCTDEKDALCQWLLECLEVRQAQSLLDIGPGTGALSIPLSRAVKRYRAVEPIASYAMQLQAQGLEVLQQAFPANLNEFFDVVLASHVINLSDTDVNLFIKAAWRLVTPAGALIIITHQGIEPDWLALTRTLKQDNLPYHQAVFARLVQLLNERGVVASQQITTNITSQTLEQMLAALAFVWSDGDRQRWQIFERHYEAIQALLEENYFRQGRFFFPFVHTFLTVTNE